MAPGNSRGPSRGRPGWPRRRRATCARAVEIGLPALFFTEHLDLEDAWFTDLEDFADHERHLVGEDGVVAVQIHVSERRGGGTPTPSPGAAVPERATSLCDDAHDAVADAVDRRGYAVECSWEGERVLEESGP